MMGRVILRVAAALSMVGALLVQAPARAETAGQEKSIDLLLRAAHALQEEQIGQLKLHDAVLEYFAVRLSGMPHAVWIGDTKAERTAFVFVDYGAPFAFQFLSAVEKFAAGAKVRCIVLPGSLSPEDRGKADLVAGATAAGHFASLYAAGVAAGDRYRGDVAALLGDAPRKSAEEAAAGREAVDQTSLARMVLISLGAKHPTMLKLDGATYAGPLTDGDAMIAFFAEASKAKEVGSN